MPSSCVAFFVSLEAFSLTHALGQGIHNLFIVIPQFLVTSFSSIVFALLDPDKSVLHGYHPENAATQQGARVGGSTMQEARERTRDDGGTDSIAITFRWGSLYGSGRTFRWLIYSRMCARWVCCNYVGFRRTNYNVFATKRFDLAIFEPIDLTMRVKCLMSASLLRLGVKQTLRQTVAIVKSRHIVRKGLGNNKPRFLTSTSVIRQQLPHCSFIFASGRC